MHTPRYIRLVLLIAVAACLAPATANAATVTDVSGGTGAWCWFADPRAVFYNGRAIFGWVDGNGSVMVGDERGARFALHENLERDDHDNPAFYVRKDGSLMAFYSAHAGSAMYYRTAISMTRWTAPRTVPADPPGRVGGYTYPHPVRAGGILYLFWSGIAPGGDGYDTVYATSPDDGETWSEARPLFDPAKTGARYIKFRADGDAIHMAYNVSHPDSGPSGIYHAVIRDGGIYRQDGTRIGELGTPLDPASADVVYRPGTDGRAWIHDLAVKDGRPVIAYATFPTIEDHHYRLAWWDGRWRDELVTKAGGSFNMPWQPRYSGGISIDPVNPAAVYLSRQIDGQFEIEKWTRGTDGWTHFPVTSGSSELNVRPFPVGRGVAWMRGSYPGFTDYQTRIAWMPTVEPPPAPAAAAVHVAAPVPRPVATTPQSPATVAPSRPAPTPRLAVRGTRWQHHRVWVRLRCLRAACERIIAVHARRHVVARGGVRLHAGRTAWVRIRMTTAGREMRPTTRLTVYLRR